jgi:hypothetical protein
LSQSASFQGSHPHWTPVRGGISADGTQGFTFGFLSIDGGDPAKRERKYLSYWVKRKEGWRVAAYRQQVRAAGEISTDMLPPALPTFSAKPQAASPIHQQSLAAAEKAFSDRSQIVGLKMAFYEFGRDDSMNMYKNVGFTIGKDAISSSFPSEVPPSLHWETERSIVASSGDLGVSIGTLWSNSPPENGKQAQGFPFFTVWRRDAPDKPWQYIAE